MKYDRDDIERTLGIWGFDTSKIDIDLINYAPMHGFAVATKEKPLLYIDDLQCCIGLMAYAQNFGFLAHISTINMDGEDYYLNENKKPVKLKRTEDLLEHILKNKEFIKTPIKINILVGVAPLKENHQSKILIIEAIKELIIRLNECGIEAYYDGEIYEWCFILDTRNGQLITPINETKSR